jgi:hypothetical protein
LIVQDCKMTFTPEDRLSMVEILVQHGAKQKHIEDAISNFIQSGGNRDKLIRTLEDLGKTQEEIKSFTGGAIQIEKKKGPRIDFSKKRA